MPKISCLGRDRIQDLFIFGPVRYHGPLYYSEKNRVQRETALQFMMLQGVRWGPVGGCGGRMDAKDVRGYLMWTEEWV